MATPVQPIAKCIVSYLYGLTAAQLDKLRAVLENMILLIDAQILSLRAQLAALDLMEYLVGAKWEIAREAIDRFQSMLAGGIAGPVGDLCPEFYHYIVDPIIGMNESTLAALLPLKDKYGRMLSATNKFDLAILYWEAAKAQMFAIIDVIDDALYFASEQAGNRVP